MKFTIPKKDLVSAVLAVGSLAARKPSMPVLGNVMIIASGHEVTFSATDLFTGARSRAGAGVAEDGGALVAAPALMAAVKALPDGDVTVRIDKTHVEIKCVKSKHRLPWSPVAEYPQLPQMDASKSHGVAASTVLAALSSVAHVMSSDEQRPNLCGAKLEFDGSRCRGIASNGHALARRDVECTVNADDVFLPHKSVPDLRRVLESAKGAGVGFAVHDGHVFIEHGSVVVSAKLTGEMFPTHYEGLLPNKPTRKRVTVLRAALADAVDRVRVHDGGMPFEVRFENGQIAMNAKCQDGSGEEDVDCDYSGDPVSVGLSGGYLSAALAAMTADDIAIEFEGPLDAVLIVPVDNRSAIQMIMPARLP